MSYMHLTDRPQYKGAIPEPFTASISYIHIIMKSKICKVDIRKIEKNVTQPRCQLFFLYLRMGVGRLVGDEFIPLFFCKKQYKRIINKSAASSRKTIFRKIRFSRDLCF